MLGTSVTIDIQLQYNGGGFTTVKTDTISGRTADKYERDYLVDIDGAFPVDLRVVRVSADSTDTNVSPTYFVAYTELIYQKLRYPNSALAAVRFQAEQFNNIPARAYRIRGIKVKIPNNATVDQDTGRITYSGTWTGTFGAAQWTTCPAWILYDLLINKRYGFGDHVAEAQLDKFAFYSASQYANELVDAGLGDGTKEARFSCNALIQNQYEAYKLINDLCSVMRCQPYWSTGALTITQDKPTDSTYLFNRTNVLEPGFSYAGSDLKTRHTVAVVSYLDLNTREQNYEIVEDRDAIEKYGWVATEIKAFACTSRGQANRLGQWILFSEQNETEVVSFTASIEAGTLVRPGAVIDVQDPVRAGVRYGGRVITSTTRTITVDDATGLPNDNATISALLPNGSLETKNIISRTGVVLTVDSDWSTLPQRNTVWVIQSVSIQTQQYRVLTVKEKEGNLYDITGLLYNASKYAHVERGFNLSTRKITNLNPIPEPPTSPNASETFYESNGKANVKIILSWAAVKGIPQYKVRYRAGNDNWEQITVSKPDAEILDTRAATYVFEIYSINSLGRQSSDFASLTYAAIGKTAVPGNVQNLSFEAINANSGRLRWSLAADLDVRVGGKVLFRHSNLTDGTASWSNSVELIAAKNGNQTEAIIPLVEGEVLVKFEDDGGRRSASATSVIVDLPTPQPRLLVQTYAEDQETPPFQGNYTNMFYVEDLLEAGGVSGIVISNGFPVDDLAPDGNWDGLPSIDSAGGILPEGEYEFASTYSFPGIFDANLRRRLASVPYIPGDFWDDKADLIDTWDLIDGDGGERVNALTYVRSTQDDPSGTPTWSDWHEFSNAIVRGRGFQFKTIATSSDETQNIILTELGAEMELQQRVEQSAVLTSGAGTYTLTYGNAFFQAPSIGITAYNMATGDYFEISSVTRTGAQVVFKNSTGTAVSRQFVATMVGYGREIV